MDVKVIGGEISHYEEQQYINRAIEQFGSHVTGLTIEVDGEFVNLSYTLDTVTPFVRIRRITGYLVGSMNTWNNAKKAEERDRVKHG